ncbi:MAG: DUF3303 family protein [Deinococcales bacterium]
MLFVTRFKNRGRRPLAEVTADRLSWSPPENVKILSEYWCSNTDVAVIVVFETDSPEAINAMTRVWADDFEIEVSPAITGEHGMELARQRTD